MKFSHRVNKGKLIEAALIKIAWNRYEKTHKTDHRINRDCLINLSQAIFLFLYLLIISVGRKMEHRLENF